MLQWKNLSLTCAHHQNGRKIFLWMQRVDTTLVIVSRLMPRLVLARKLNEKIIIHDDDGVLARVKISKVDRNQVRLTFEAESEIRIDRQEVFDNNAPTNEKISISLCYYKNANMLCRRRHATDFFGSREWTTAKQATLS